MDKVTVPNMGEVWLCAGRPVLIMGDTAVPDKDGAVFIWCADFAHGERIIASLGNLTKAPDQIPFKKSVRLITSWARKGDVDAMWWLGCLYETGRPTVPANGGKALAYYLAAFRCQPSRFGQEIVDRVLRDGTKLFAESRASAKHDETPANHREFLKNFREYRELNTHGRLHYPEDRDWEWAVAIAAGLDA